MKTHHFLLSALVIVSLSVFSTSVQAENIAQLERLEDLGGITTGLLDRLGYECDTVANVGIVCKKCKEERFTEKCKTYICDAVTKKCRQQDITLPNL